MSTETCRSVTSTRKQSVFCPTMPVFCLTDASAATKFQKYDFLKPILSCTPDIFLYMQ